MNDRQDSQVPGALFGTVRKLPVTGNHQPSAVELAELAQPPDPRLGALNIFCQGCGTISHPHEEGGRELAAEAGVPVPPDWKNKYIQVQRCVCCGDGLESPELVHVQL